jgi:hypothetical protein
MTSSRLKYNTNYNNYINTSSIQQSPNHNTYNNQNNTSTYENDNNKDNFNDELVSFIYIKLAVNCLDLYYFIYIF